MRREIEADLSPDLIQLTSLEKWSSRAFRLEAWQNSLRILGSRALEASPLFRADGESWLDDPETDVLFERPLEPAGVIFFM